MKWIYLLLIICHASVQSLAQGPCQLKLDNIVLDTAASTCSHLFFKYTYSGGTPNAYFWTYADGNSCTCFKPKNVYNTNGTFNVCGKIKDANGCVDSLCITAHVNCFNPCDLSEIGIYTFDTLSYTCDEYEFNTVTSPNAKRIKWDFGDNDSSSDKFTVHQYKKNGVYQVRLSIQDSMACADTANLTVVVDCVVDTCDFKITAIDTSSGADCKTKMFILKSNKKPMTVKWVYGDGQNALTNGNISSRTYADTGLYNLCTYALDSHDCRDTFCVWVKVKCPQKPSSLQLFEHNTFMLYPNPFADVLHIESPGQSSYIIYDITLKQLAKGILFEGKNAINLADLESGTYVLKLENIDCSKYFSIRKE